MMSFVMIMVIMLIMMVVIMVIDYNGDDNSSDVYNDDNDDYDVILCTGLFQLGPTPLKAVKEGNVDMKYDTRFVFAEVNADTVYWKREKAGGPFKPFEVNRKAIGMTSLFIFPAP